jgi:predicted hotdog family 3-hydroxylacyl-ACP dehydratase
MPTTPDDWLPLEKPRITPESRWESRVRFGSQSAWFSGHFEKFPLLPGVALLALASETLKRQAAENGRLLDVSGFSRVRFRHLVLPGDELVISVAVMPCVPEAKLDFQITCQTKLVAQGFLKVREEGATLPLNTDDRFDRIKNTDRDEMFPAEPLIPHRHRMKLLEWVRRPIEKTLQAEATVNANWPLHRDGVVSSVICIELVAQAIAALRTWNTREVAKARPGFVVGVKEMEFSPSSFPVGTRLFVHIAENYHVGEYAVYEGQVNSGSDFTCKIIIQAMEAEEGVFPDLADR